MFDLDQFVSDCRAAMKQDPSGAAVREVLARAVSDPASIIRAVGEPQRAEMQKLYQSTDFTVLNVIWAPWMQLLPHNHRMWAMIGIYTGREDNIFWRRVPGTEGKVEAAAAKSISAKETTVLGHDIIHSVNNPIPRLTAALHIYGGDFFGVPRSEWDPESLLERCCDGDKMRQRFEEANRIWLQPDTKPLAAPR